jgi:penicillin-binding protein 1A
MPQSSPAQPPVALPVPVAPAGGAPAGNAPPAIPPIPVPRVDADAPAQPGAVSGPGTVSARPL